MLELTGQQIGLLERIRERGFEIVAFPLYANFVGVRRGSCAALLAPSTETGMRLYGPAFYLVAGNPSVRVRRHGRDVFVWKGQEVEVTSERDGELERFSEELSEQLMASA
jgi:hypothetical protein